MTHKTYQISEVTSSNKNQAPDPFSPYFLHPSINSGIVLVTQPLSGNNYATRKLSTVWKDICRPLSNINKFHEVVQSDFGVLIGDGKLVSF